MDKKPKIGISTCLLEINVRYNGKDKRDSALLNALGDRFEFIPICPEVECGFGVPREPVHLEGDPENPRLVTTETGQDLTETLREWCDLRIAELKKENLRGFIFKERSPSCGHCIPVLVDGEEVPGVGKGFFARRFSQNFPEIPIAEAESLHDSVEMQNFIKCVEGASVNEITDRDRRMAKVCVNCPVCRHARKTQKGAAYWLTKNIDSKICPFCKAYERVYDRPAWEN